MDERWAKWVPVPRIPWKLINQRRNNCTRLRVEIRKLKANWARPRRNHRIGVEWKYVLEKPHRRMNVNRFTILLIMKCERGRETWVGVPSISLSIRIQVVILFEWRMWSRRSSHYSFRWFLFAPAHCCDRVDKAYLQPMIWCNKIYMDTAYSVEQSRMCKANFAAGHDRRSCVSALREFCAYSHAQ